MDIGRVMERGTLYKCLLNQGPVRCWAGLVGEDRALTVLWAFLWDQPLMPTWPLMAGFHPAPPPPTHPQDTLLQK